MSFIGRRFDRDFSTIYPLLSRAGGIRPPDRKRSRLWLTLVEREIISRGIVAGQSIRAIAKVLYRSASTISRNGEMETPSGPTFNVQDRRYSRI